MAAIDDDNLVTHHEEGVSAPFGMDLDQRGRHFDDAHAGRNDGADAEREVDAVNTRHVAAGQDGLLDLGALLGGQVDGAAGTLALLSLPLLSLALLRALPCLTLLGRWSLLALLSLRRLALRRGLVTLLCGLVAIALTTLSLTLFVFVSLTLVLLTLVLLARAGGLIPLALTTLSLALLALVFLLALLTLAARRLTLLALVFWSCPSRCPGLAGPVAFGYGRPATGIAGDPLARRLALPGFGWLRIERRQIGRRPACSGLMPRRCSPLA